MEKPTIFLSHSSKDASALQAFKKRFCELTSGVINVFLSSDGESIPFGNNWVHKIDEGLKSASAMFVFVTQNSMLSNWIYFEAGYAYSKGIKVIPVGLGVDITILKPPLNLLQGFNIQCTDSLNNFIAIVNREFSLNFHESFSEQDYSDIKRLSFPSDHILFHKLFPTITCEIWPDKKNGESASYIKDLYNELPQYLNDNNVPYSTGTFGYRNYSAILFAGVYIVQVIDEPNQSRLELHVSPYNFVKSFALIKKWFSNYSNRDRSFFYFYPCESTALMTKKQAVSSIISQHADRFKYDSDHLGRYLYKSISFAIFDKGASDKPLWVLSVVYDVNLSMAEEITELISVLIDIGIVSEN